MEILSAIGLIYLACSAIATITPSNYDDKIMSKIGRFFDVIGFNPKQFKK